MTNPNTRNSHGLASIASHVLSIASPSPCQNAAKNVSPSIPMREP